jgi:hypothetical protein
MTESPFNLLVAVSTLCSVFVIVFWMITGYRAMRAHERIAAALERIALPTAPRG